MKPYYQDSAVTIYHGDCREILPQLEPVDLIITSPPYNIGTGNGGAWQVSDWYADSMEEGDYQEWQLECLEAMRLKAKVICYNHKVRQRNNLAIHPMEWITLSKLRLFQEIVWDRGSTHNYCGNYFWPLDERIFVLVSGDPPKVLDKKLTTIWRMQFEVNSPHPAPFPIMLPMRLIKALDGQMILDPFSGSGTTLRAAKDLGRKAIGIEIEEKYCEIAARRMAQEVLAL